MRVALTGGIVLVLAVYLLALFVALDSPSSARSAPHVRDLSEARFVALAAQRCEHTRAALGPDAVRNGGSPTSRSALVKELAATRAERDALRKLIARTRAPGLDRVRLLRFVRTEGRIVTTLGLAARRGDVAQAGDLVRVAYARVTQGARDLGVASCGLA